MASARDSRCTEEGKQSDIVSKGFVNYIVAVDALLVHATVFHRFNPRQLENLHATSRKLWEMQLLPSVVEFESKAFECS